MMIPKAVKITLAPDIFGALIECQGENNNGEVEPLTTVATRLLCEILTERVGYKVLPTQNTNKGGKRAGAGRKRKKHETV